MIELLDDLVQTPRGRGIPSTRARTAAVRGRGAKRSGRGAARTSGGIQTQKVSGQVSIDH